MFRTYIVNVDSRIFVTPSTPVLHTALTHSMHCILIHLVTLITHLLHHPSVMSTRRPRSPTADGLPTLVKRPHTQLKDSPLHPLADPTSLPTRRTSSSTARTDADASHRLQPHVEPSVEPHLEPLPDPEPDLHRPHAAPRLVPAASHHPLWCLCGCCEEVVEQKVGAQPPLCCMKVVSDPRARSKLGHGTVCMSDRYTSVIKGVTQREYDHWSSSRLKQVPRPPTFAACDNAAKRIIIYAELHARLKDSAGWESMPHLKRLTWKPLPECMKQATRRQCPDPVAAAPPAAGRAGTEEEEKE